MKSAAKRKRNLVCYMILMTLLFGVFLCSCIHICAYHQDLQENARELEEITMAAGIRETLTGTDIRTKREAETAGDMDGSTQIDWTALREINQDITGWIVFNDCMVNNPVVQAKDNDYYLHHSFRNKKNDAGCIFLDCRNKSLEDKNLVIYGHNTRDRTMFGSLKDILKEDYFEKEGRDRIWLFEGNGHSKRYQIFSYYVIEKEDYYITTSFATDEAYESFLNTIKDRSIGKCSVEVTKEDKILTLSTCYGAMGTKKRLAIHAVLEESSAEK